MWRPFLFVWLSVQYLGKARTVPALAQRFLYKFRSQFVINTTREILALGAGLFLSLFAWLLVLDRSAARASMHAAADRAEWLMRLFLAKRGKRSTANRLSKFLNHPVRFVRHNLVKRRFILGGDAWARTFFGDRMRVSLNDEDGALLYYAGTLAVKEQPIIRFMMQRLRNGLCLYDVGANFGFYTRLGIHLGARVHAFEAGPTVGKYTRLNAGGGKVTLRAVSNSMDPVVFFENDIRKTGMSTAIEEAAIENGVNYRRTTVPAITLDEYALGQGNDWPDMIKLDVEGFEANAIEGARELLQRARPLIVMEVVTRDAVKERSARAIRMLEEIGYKSHRITESGAIVRQDIDLEAIEQSDNFVFAQELR